MRQLLFSHSRLKPPDLLRLFFFKGVQIVENFVIMMQDTGFFTGVME